MSHDSIPPVEEPIAPKHKYDRVIFAKYENKSIVVDVYSVLEAFDEPDAPIAHAIKKLLCAGLRGKATRKQDLEEAIQAINRALDKEKRCNSENQ